MNNDFQAARCASGMTLQEAASASGISAASYTNSRDKHPENFRLKELQKLYVSMSETAKPILTEAVVSFLCQKV